MIRFTCQSCGQPVRVPDKFGGKKGRCPSCKQVVQIPAESAPSATTDEMDDLAALLGPSTPAGQAPPAPPPPSIEDAPDAGAEAPLPTPHDPRGKTDRIPTAEAEGLLEFADDEGEAPDRPPAGAAPVVVIEEADTGPPKRRPKALMIAIAVGAVVIAAGAVTFVLVARPWEPKRPKVSGRHMIGSAGGSASTSRPPTRPTTATAPAPAGPKYTLSPQLQAVTAGTPAGSFCLLHVDLEAAVDAIAAIPSRQSQTVRAVAESKLWTDAAQRIAEGAMPRTATLFLTTGVAPAGKLFGKFYGAMPSRGVADPSAGLWAALRPDAPVPHFLVRLTGGAARPHAAALTGRAKALGALDPTAPGKAVTAGMLRMGPAGVETLMEATELFVGTTETLDEAGEPAPMNAQALDRLRLALRKVPTDRPVVGCVVVPVLWDRVGRALHGGRPVAVPGYAGDKTLLVFSIDPKPDGQATIVLSAVHPGSAKQVESLVAPMVVTATGADVEARGAGTHAVEALVKVLPGFAEVVLKGLQIATPIAPAVVEAPRPDPATKPATQPTTKPAPGPAKKIPIVCVNPQCPSRGLKMDVDRTEVPADVLAGVAPLKCPQCGKDTAVVAVQCAKCKKWFPGTLDTCPRCGAKK